MFKATMVEYHIHHYLQAFLMGLVNQSTIIFVAAEAWIYLVIIGGRVTVIGAMAVSVGRVVLQNGGEPKRRNAQLIEIIEVFHNAVEVASVAQTGLRAVFPIGIEALDLRRMALALGKTVGHEHVKYVGIRSEEHTSELQSRQYLVCRLLLEK